MGKRYPISFWTERIKRYCIRTRYRRWTRPRIRNSFQNALETVNYDLKKYKITLQDIELSLERILKQRKTTLDEFARNDLALPNYEDEEDEFDTFGEFYG